MPERGECEGLFPGEDAILTAKKDGEEFARQERERGWEGGRESQAEETACVQRQRSDEQLSLFVSRELSSTSCKHKALGLWGARAAQAC